MNSNILASLSVLALLPTVPAFAGTLSVTSTATQSGIFYDYNTDFSITGTGLSLDNLYLGSDDISPTDVVIELNGHGTKKWSWLGEDTPENFLQFFSTNGSLLRSGDDLDVTYTSPLAPEATHFAIGLNSNNGRSSNQVLNITAPTTSSTIPEPGSLHLLLPALSGLIFLAFKRSSRLAR